MPLKAVVHCQGSISFMMAAVAGWLDPRVTHIVSSAVSLFIDVTESTWLKQRLAMPLVAKTFSGLDAQWGIRPSTPTAGLFAALAKRMERPCGNPSCQVANFMYGSGWDVLSATSTTTATRGWWTRCTNGAAARSATRR